MLALFLLVLTFTESYARNFNITYFSVPEIVPPGQHEVVIECRYDANFTILSWFKGQNEFFRYKPGTTPSTRSFPIAGVGSIDIEACGPTACRLKLGGLTKAASDIYRCDIEKNVPPYLFESRQGNMEVHVLEPRKPLIEGLASEFKEGDMMQAYCRAASNVEIHWYLNGKEVEELRNSLTFKMKSARFLFYGVPPTITIQCAESRNGKLSGSKDAVAYWIEDSQNHLGQNLRAPNKSWAIHCNLILIISVKLVTLVNYFKRRFM